MERKIRRILKYCFFFHQNQLKNVRKQKTNSLQDSINNQKNLMRIKNFLNFNFSNR